MKSPLARAIEAVIFASFLVALIFCVFIYKRIADAPFPFLFEKTATVTGRVFFKGKPLAMGTVSFFGPVNNRIVIAKINRDGTYTCYTVPLGEVGVGVESPPPQDPALAENNGMKVADKDRAKRQREYEEEMKLWVPVPVKYGHWTPDKLIKVIVTEGQGTLNIELP